MRVTLETSMPYQPKADVTTLEPVETTRAGAVSSAPGAFVAGLCS